MKLHPNLGPVYSGFVAQKLLTARLYNNADTAEISRLERVYWGLPFTVGESTEKQQAAVLAAEKTPDIPGSCYAEFHEWCKIRTR